MKTTFTIDLDSRAARDVKETATLKSAEAENAAELARAAVWRAKIESEKAERRTEMERAATWRAKRENAEAERLAEMERAAVWRAIARAVSGDEPKDETTDDDCVDAIYRIESKGRFVYGHAGEDGAVRFFAAPCFGADDWPDRFTPPDTLSEVSPGANPGEYAVTDWLPGMKGSYESRLKLASADEAIAVAAERASMRLALSIRSGRQAVPATQPKDGAKTEKDDGGLIDAARRAGVKVERGDF